MVQYILTPWRDRQELLLVRRQFYAYPSWHQDQSSSSGVVRDEGEQQRRRQTHHQAVARVSMWVQRGNCPHMVESTALLTAAVLADEEERSSTVGVENNNHSASASAAASSAYTLRAAYSAAFSRFVTGLLDGHQDKLRKQSMFSLAKTIGLPATFVELRHQSTHEQLPSLAKLRSAAKKALLWIWGYYWKGLDEDDLMSNNCEEAIIRHLRAEDLQGKSLEELRRRWGDEKLLSTIAAVSKSKTLPGQMHLKCLMLSAALKAKSQPTEEHEVVLQEVEQGQSVIEAEQTHIKLESELKTESKTEHKTEPVPLPELDSRSDFNMGWSTYQGPWKPKPIGMV